MEKQYVFFDTPAGCRAGVVAGVVFFIVVVLSAPLLFAPRWLVGLVVVALASVAASIALAVDRRAVRRMRPKGSSEWAAHAEPRGARTDLQHFPRSRGEEAAAVTAHCRFQADRELACGVELLRA